MDKALDDNRPSTARATPKDFFLWAGAMLALYGSVIAFLALVFDYINYTFPDPLQYFPPNPYQSGISYEMASFIILVPLCLWLLRVIHKNIERDSSRADVWVRRWALYFTLFIAGATIVGDLITLLNTFLGGTEITLRFGIKVLLVLLVASAGFMHFLADLRGYWEKNPGLSRRVSWGVGVLAVLTIFAGFLIIGTPWQARLYQIDAQKVDDLNVIQSQIVSYWQLKQKLPASLNDLYDSLSNYTLPTDPQTGEAYSYQALDRLSFNLCATFNTDSGGRTTEPSMSVPVALGQYGGKMNANWQHAAGKQCFLRTIDPTLYPPVKAPQ